MSNLASSCARFTNRMVRPLGIRVSRTNPSVPDRNTLPAALARLSTLDLGIRTIIDVGASNGSWSRTARSGFSNTSVLAFEPLQERWPELDEWQASDPRVHLVKGVAGAASGMVPFYVANDLDGSGVSENADNARMVPVVTIDNEIAERNLPGAYLVKLDTHGYEVPILDGATETLKQAHALIIEVYNFKLIGDSLRFHEMCEYLATLGFRCFDIFDILRRPADQVLWQVDMVFLKESHPVFQQTTYR